MKPKCPRPDRSPGLFRPLLRMSKLGSARTKKPRPLGGQGLDHQVPRTGLTSLRSVGPGLAVDWIPPCSLRSPGPFRPLLRPSKLGSARTKKPRPRRGQGFDHQVPRTGLEPAQPFGHYPLKVACLPISPPGQGLQLSDCTGEGRQIYTGGGYGKTSDMGVAIRTGYMVCQDPENEETPHF